MTKRESDQLLNIYTRHTNIEVPFNTYITPTKFPKQDQNLLGTTVRLKFRDQAVCQFEDDFEVGVDQYENNYFAEENCTVLRCDSEFPYRMICISEDYKYIILTDTRMYDTKICIYPMQYTEFIGIVTYNQYFGEINEIKAVTLRCDNGEPCYSILMEYVEDGKVRFLLGDECQSRLYDYFDAPDYDGMDAPDHGKYIDVDGGKEDVRPADASFKIIDGGPANILHQLFNDERTVEEIINLRHDILDGKELYGFEEGE